MKTLFSLNITTKEPNISPFTKFHKLLKCLESRCLLCAKSYVNEEKLKKKWHQQSPIKKKTNIKIPSPATVIAVIPSFLHLAFMPVPK